MKRDHQNLSCSSSTKTETSHSSSMEETCGFKIWVREEQGLSGLDELLGVLGYRVLSNNMVAVADKLEQFEVVLGSAKEDGVSHLSDTAHYNPSDLSAWVQSMLCEINTVPGSDPVGDLADQKVFEPKNISTIYNDDSEYDLRAIPGIAAYPRDDVDIENTRKRVKLESGLCSESGLIADSDSDYPANSITARPVIVPDSQETGVRLVHALMACAEAVQQDNFKVADALLKHVGLLAAAQDGAMRKVVTYFAEALARRIYRIYPRECLEPSYTDLLQMHFYETCPYMKFAHFTANQAILESFGNADKVHVIDFGLNQGMQWPALIQALATRPGGAPVFKLTGIGPPQPDNTDILQEVGWKLTQLAARIGVKLEFRGFVANSLADLEPEIFDVEPDETLAVNSIFELHRVLASEGRIGKVLNTIKSLRPKIVTLVEPEANHNSPVFLDRFTESLHYYSSLFDSLEGIPPTEDAIMSELYLGRQILNVVACEGADRVERHETSDQWQRRMESGGFSMAHLGSNAYKQASMLLALFTGGDGYRVEENDGRLMLCWHTRPLIATSAWRLAEV